MRLTELLHRLEETTLEDWFEGRLQRVVDPTGEEVLFIHRRHWLVLIGPAVLVVVGSAVMMFAAQPRTWLVLFAGATIILERWRRGWSTLRTAFAVALWLVPFWLTLGVPTALFRAGALFAFAMYFVVVAAKWAFEALVLTETSLWKLSGVLTTASPKAPLTQILFQDVRQNTVEQALGCGTLIFDTAGTSDDPLAKFGPVDDPFVVSAAIHQQRLRVSQSAKGAKPPAPPSPW